MGREIGDEMYREHRNGLESKLPLIISFLSAIIALFLLSYTITGYTVIDVSKNSSINLGILFFLSSLAFAYMWKRNKN